MRPWHSIHPDTSSRPSCRSYSKCPRNQVVKVCEEHPGKHHPFPDKPSTLQERDRPLSLARFVDHVAVPRMVAFQGGRGEKIRVYFWQINATCLQKKGISSRYIIVLHFHKLLFRLKGQKTIFIHACQIVEGRSTLYLITITDTSFVSSIPASHTVESLLFAVYFQREDYLTLLQAENFKHE